MNLIKCYQTNSTWYKKTSNDFAPKGVLWHSTGANNPTLKRYVQPTDGVADYDEMIKLLGKNAYGNDWNHKYHGAGLNAWIGKLADGSIATIQAGPWNKKPWGCGDKASRLKNGWSLNETHLQFEICEDNLNNREYFEKVYREAIELTAYWCKLYNINPTGTFTYRGDVIPCITDHAGSHAIGHGGNHGDVGHWFTKYLGKNYMEQIRNDVAKEIAKDKSETPTPEYNLNDGAMTDKEMFEYFKANGLTDAGTAGLMGNLLAESAMSSTNLQNTFEKKLGMTDIEYTIAVDKGTYTNFVKDSAGYGLAQWTYWTRKQNLLNFMKENGVSIGNKRKQVEFLIKELKNYKNVYNILTTTNDVKKASDVVLIEFESPANVGETVKATRCKYSQSFYDKYATKLPEKPQFDFKVGDLVKIIGTTYYSGKTIPAWVKRHNWYIKSISGDRVVIDKNEKGTNSICSPVKASDLALVNPPKPAEPTPEVPKKKTNEELAAEVQKGLWGNGQDRVNRLTAAGHDYKAVQAIVNKLVAEQNKPAEKPLQVGDVVMIKKNCKVYGKSYGFQSWVYNSKLYVREIREKSVVISTLKVGAVTGVVAKEDIIR